MKISLTWLKKFLSTTKTVDEIANSLVNLGIEVEEIEELDKKYNHFQIAQIIECIPHPQADKLQICKIRFTEDENQPLLSVICGAANARANLKTVLANIDAIVPFNGLEIKKTKIRGEYSHGMLCSEQELGLSEGGNGIIELDEEAPVGQDLAKYFGFDDTILHLSITPNRGDLLSVYGIARELASQGMGKLINPLPVPESDLHPSFKVQASTQLIKNTAAEIAIFCNITQINNKNNPTKLKWMQNLLRNIGLATISPVVDITNYIAHTFGQPMHAYDASKIKGDLKIKKLDQTSSFKALNSLEYNLLKDDIIVLDSNHKEEEIVAIAGIIGGDQSKVDEETTKIILEAAVFDHISISKTARRLKIFTASQNFFTKQVDAAATYKSLLAATHLIKDYCQGIITDIKIQAKSLDDNLDNKVIELDFKQIYKRMGFSPDIKEVMQSLTAHHFKVESNKSEEEDLILKISPPSWRKDVHIAEDIIEEVARFAGYDQIPLIPLKANINLTNHGQKSINSNRFLSSLIKSTQKTMASIGYNEVVTFSFMHSTFAQNFVDEIDNRLFLQNPISSDLDYLRPTIIGNLLEGYLKNYRRSFEQISLFEIGPVFLPNISKLENDKPIQKIYLTALRSGSALSKNPHTPSRQVDFYDIKGDLEYFFHTNNLIFNQKTEFIPQHFHPGCSLEILSPNQEKIGYIGELHPTLAQKLGISEKLFIFEIELSLIAKLIENQEAIAKKAIFSDFPIVTRDFCFLIPKDLEVGQLIDFLKKIDVELIQKIEIFDIFSGSQIPVELQSIAFSVLIQAQDRTLTDTEIQSISTKIVTSLAAKFNAVLRY